jgi:uncharacterized protein
MDQRLHQALLRIDTYPGEHGPVTFRETHVSRLYFTAAHVYKIKKAVDFGFLRFTSLAERQHFCQEELRLNRRLCPAAYLRVAAIRQEGAHFSIDGPGDTVDYAVVMRRLPQERMLDHLIERQDPHLPAEMERLAERLAAFHRQAEICQETTSEGDLDRVRQNWRENFEQTEGQIGRHLLPQAHELFRKHIDSYLEEQNALLRRREAQGMVRDGHGDLHCEHVCLTEPLCIYDCIEFNRRFRVADVAADLAFLLMDLDFCGRRDLGQRLLSSYLAEAGDDAQMPLLLPFYKIYRAFVRAKVEGFLADDTEAVAEARQEAAALARRYYNLALGYLAPPALVITAGLMGAGKSTVAAALCRAHGGVLLRSDELRKRLAGLAPTTRRSEPFGSGIYAPSYNKRTYSALLEEAGQALAASRGVVVDAAFVRQSDREAFRRLAQRAKVPFLLVHVDCAIETLVERLEERQRVGDDLSDGRAGLLAAQAAIFEPITETIDSIRIDSASDVEYNVHLLLCRLAAPIGMTA